MSKRKREGDDKLEPDAVDKSEGEGALNTSSSLSAAKPGGQAELQTNGSHGTCSPGEESTPARVDLSKAADLASKAMSFTGGKDGPVKITICGEEVTLKGTAGRRKRKQPIETLILLAYKGRLAMACKNNNMVAALDLYREMKSKEIKQDPSIHQMVLAVCGGSPGERDELDPGNGAVGLCPKSGRESISNDPLAAAAAATAVASGRNSAEENTSAAAEAALQILSDVVKDGKTSLPESAYTGVIRACCLDGRPDKARQVLESLKRAGGKPRLRTYSPLLEAYSRLDGRLQDCMEIWRDGVSPNQGLTMTEREYLHLIAACTRARHEECFLEVMAEYMEDVLQPRSRRSWEVLKEWFRVAGESKITNPSVTTTSTSSPPKDALENSSDAVETNVDANETRAASGESNGALEEAPSDPPRPPPAVEAADHADHAWKVSECGVGKDGSCGNCGEVLGSIELSEDDERRLLKQIEVLVCTNEERKRQWEGYRGWLERRGRDRYNVIIDGANLGYFKQNAAAAGELADLRQVDWAVKKYQGEGKKPLAVLHSRHLVEKRLSDEAKEILKRWREAEVIQSCAPKNNDDWYWLYAAVYAGGRVLVLTNDEMRDHHFSMLSHRSFQRWKERHQARFSFGDWNDDMREVVVEEPASYSKRTQKGRGGDSWHVPLEGSDDWLCITRREEE